MGWNLRTKLCCIAPEKRNTSRDSLQGLHNSYIMFWIVKVNFYPPFLSSASGSVNQAEMSNISKEIKSCTQQRKNYNTSVPKRIKNEVGENVLIHGIKSALKKFWEKYPKYTFIRISVNNWKKKIEKDKKK